MKFYLTLLLFTPLYLFAQFGVSVNFAAGDLDEYKVATPGIEFRYEEGTEHLLSRIYTGFRGSFNGQQNYLQFQYNAGWVVGAGYNRNFMLLAGIENQVSNREVTREVGERVKTSVTESFWFYETQFLVAFQIKGNDKNGNALEIMPFYSKGSESEYLGVRVSYTFNLD